jgi:hypothetical protein
MYEIGMNNINKNVYMEDAGHEDDLDYMEVC